MDLVGEHAEEVGKLVLREMRCLRAGADMDAPILTTPHDRAVSLHVRVLDLVCIIRAFVYGVRFGKALFHIAHFAFDLYENIMLGLLDAGFGTRDLMKDRRSGAHGFLGIEDGGEHFIINFDQAARFLRRGFSLGDHCNEALPNEPCDIIQHVGVIRIDVKIVMGRRCIETSRHVLPREYSVHARNGQGFLLTDRLDARVGMRGTDNLELEHSLHCDIHRVVRIAGNNGFAQGVLNAGTTGLTNLIVFD